MKYYKKKKLFGMIIAILKLVWQSIKIVSGYGKFDSDQPECKNFLTLIV